MFVLNTSEVGCSANEQRPLPKAGKEVPIVESKVRIEILVGGAFKVFPTDVK